MNNQNSIQQKLEEIVIGALKGASIQSCKWLLVELAESHNINPFELFSQTNYTEDTSGLENILKVLAPDQVNDLKEHFIYHCHSLHMSHNLINFLEFLTHQGYHRLHPHIHSIKNLKPIQYSYGMYSLGGLSILIGASVTIGIFHSEIWNQMLDYFLKHGQAILKFTLQHIWIAENIAFLTLIYRLIDFISKCYKVYNNHATTTENKINKILKFFLVDSFIIVAQGLLYASQGLINPVSGYLFIASSFVELAYSAISLYKLSKPIEPVFNINDSQDLFLANQAHYLEEIAFYQRASGRCYHELWAFALIAGGTVIAITLSNHLLMIGIIMVMFQFMVYQLKDYMIFQNNKNINQHLQKDIRRLYTSEPHANRRHLQNEAQPLYISESHVNTPNLAIVKNSIPPNHFNTSHRLFKPCALNDTSIMFEHPDCSLY